MNVVPAWREGITGKDVVVTILDDGLETDHPDLERNYVSKKNLIMLELMNEGGKKFFKAAKFFRLIQARDIFFFL